MTKAPATEARPETALVLAVHGIRGGPGCAVDHAAVLQRRRLFSAVSFGCHKGAPDLVEAVERAPAGEVVVAPLLMAEAFTLHAMTRRLAKSVRRPFHMAPALGTHPRLAELIVSEGEAGCAARGWRPAAVGLLLVGHGTRRNPNSGATTERHADRVRAMAGFAAVGVAFLDQDPSIPDALRALDAEHAVAVGLFLDRGEHGEHDIPALLAAAGKDAVYSGPIGIHPAVPDLILDQIRSTEPHGLAA